MDGPKKQLWGGNPLMWSVAILAAIMIAALMVHGLPAGTAFSGMGD